MKFKVLQTESALGLGGQELRVLAEVEGLLRRGHEVWLAVQPQSRLEALAVKGALPVVAVRMRKRDYPFFVYRLVRLMDEKRVDIVNTHGSEDSWAGGLAARLSRQKPVVIRTRHKSTPVSNHPLNRILYRQLTDRIVTTGEGVRQQLIQHNGLDGAKIVSIPTGVDLNTFNSEINGAAVRREWGIEADEFLVGTVSFLRDYKGIVYYIQAARRILEEKTNVRFLIVGDGPQRDILAAQIEGFGLGGKVLMTGHREDVPQILSALDLFVLPSSGAEGVPQAVVQALAMGKPVIATDVGSVSEVILQGETGILIPPKDSEAIVRATLELMRSGDLRQRLARRGKKLVQAQYNAERMLENLELFYQDALMGSQSIGGQG